MTSIRRELDEEGELRLKTEKLFWDNIGQTPMCCHEAKRLYGGDWFLKCDMLKGPLRKDKFDKFCLQCQAGIAQELIEKQLAKTTTMKEVRALAPKINKATRLILRLTRDEP